MPPKVKITKSDIIEKALCAVRRSGVGAVNARSIAEALGCSTQPIFSNFATMDELMHEVSAAAYSRYLQFLQNEDKTGKYPRYKAFGMAYIRFAREEKELFKLLFMCDRKKNEITSYEDFDASVDMVMQYCGISRERAKLFHLELWSCVHGIASMLVTSFLDLEEELISNMITDVFMGLKKRYAEEDRT